LATEQLGETAEMNFANALAASEAVENKDFH
jgi:hypothetical protein